MSTMIAELYHALKQAGVDDTHATAAAAAVWGHTQDLATKADLKDFVTKADLQTALAELRVQLLYWMVGIQAAGVGLFLAIVGLVWGRS